MSFIFCFRIEIGIGKDNKSFCFLYIILSKFCPDRPKVNSPVLPDLNPFDVGQVQNIFVRLRSLM